MRTIERVMGAFFGDPGRGGVGSCCEGMAYCGDEGTLASKRLSNCWRFRYSSPARFFKCGVLPWDWRD